MQKHITKEELFDGAASFTKDCIKNKLGFLDQLEYSNGYAASDFDFVISKNPKLHLHTMMQIMNYENIKPASQLYIRGYNQRAVELGIPLYNSFGILVKIISILIVIHLRNH
jgi:hypothetical protein